MEHSSRNRPFWHKTLTFGSPLLLAAGLGLWLSGTPNQNSAPAVPRMSKTTSMRAKSRPTAGLSLSGGWQSISAEQKNRRSPDQPLAKFAVQAVAGVSAAALAELNLGELATGERVTMEIGRGQRVEGRVNLVQRPPTNEPNGWTRVAGTLTEGGKGSFILARKQQLWSGLIRLPEQNLAYLLAMQGEQPILQEKTLSSVECHAYPRKKASDQNDTEEEMRLPTTGPLAPPNIQGADGMRIPQLSSLPGANAVIYLDFDGETVTDAYWNEGFTIVAKPALLKGKVLSASSIQAVWQSVAEDFLPFKVNVTTNAAEYAAAPVGKRNRCLVTSTEYWYPEVGGIAGINSFSEAGKGFFSDDVPSWVFTSSFTTNRDIAEVISHEIGHTLGLSHDSLFDAAQTEVVEEYFPGHGTWGPIMGGSYGRAITQWSRCEYRNGGNWIDDSRQVEDDLLIISGSTNGIGWRDGDVADFVPGVRLENTGIFKEDGILGDRGSSTADVDVYRFETAGGPWLVDVLPAETAPNVNLQVELLSDQGSITQTSNLSTSLAAKLSGTLAPGTYYLRILATGNGDPARNGYSAYGCLGAYRLRGHYVAMPETVAQITRQPLGATLRPGMPFTLTVEATSNLALSYRWLLNGQPTNLPAKPTISIPKVAAGMEGNYTCEVTNAKGTAISQPATLTLHYAPLIKTQPQKTTTAVAGSSVSLIVTALGSPSPQFQWQKEGIDLPGQTTGTLSLANLHASQTGSYRCRISNIYGTVTSAVATIKVTSPVEIVTEPPATLGVPLAGTASVSVTAVGTPPLAFQWYKNGLPVSGARSATLAFKGISASINGIYHCVVKNTHAGVAHTDTSADCVVTAGTAPQIVTQPPALTTRTAGQGLSLTLAGTGVAPIGYEWRKNGVPMPGQTGPSLSFLSSTYLDDAVYTCLLKTAFGNVVSTPARVIIEAPPVIAQQPTPSVLRVPQKQLLSLSTQAYGSPKLSYQWRRNGQNIAKATKPTLTQVAQESGTYDCVVRNAFGSVVTATASVEVVLPASVVLPAVVNAEDGGNFTYSAQVTGTGPLTLQWLKNGSAIPGQTTSSLTISQVKPADAASYSLRMSNELGTSVSKSMLLNVLVAPGILRQPALQEALEGKPFTLSVAASGSAPLTYQWYFNGSRIEKATAASYKVAAARPDHSGNYHVVVTNPVGTVTSETLHVDVLFLAQPIVNAFSPGLVNPRHFLRVQGQNLGWTTQVSFLTGTGEIRAGYVTVSNEQLLVTVPALPSGGYRMMLRSLGGEHISSISVQITSQGANDWFRNAQVIPSTGGTLKGTLPSNFSAETGEPAHAWAEAGPPEASMQPRYSAWFQFTPVQSGLFQVSTIGSVFDTRLGIYTGAAVDALTMVNGGDDPGEESQAVARFIAAAGVTYWIALDGFDTVDPTTNEDYKEYGAYTLRVTPSTGVNAPRHSAPSAFAITLPPTMGQATTLALHNDAGQTHEVIMRQGDGTTFLLPSGGALPQILEATSDFTVAWRQQTPEGSWGLLLNGEWLLQNQPKLDFTPTHFSIFPSNIR